ncbi:hypothetical protein P692DRAFT_20915829 [Suillus brevipes Sb2]|nr:hypothetical protein P692DRAFT_20915829 [Suillus brevipes Sb2]
MVLLDSYLHWQEFCENIIEYLYALTSCVTIRSSTNSILTLFKILVNNAPSSALPTSIVWSPDSRCLISACHDSQIYVWSAPAGAH